MPPESASDVKVEIGHVLFIDIVGYSKLLIDEQSKQLQTLKQIVRGTEQFRIAETQGKLLRLPTGDGGALVFRTSLEAPVLCALEIAKAVKNHPELHVRMGVHSGPVNEISDLNEQANLAGAGINIAQRVMDCGDAGHILISRHVAEDLEQFPRWRAYLHDLGECEVKHGVRVGLANLYDREIGNAQLPKKLQTARKHRTQMRWAAVAIGLVMVAALAAALLFFLRKEPAPSLATVVEKSIAVLPFENLSEEKANAFFAEGVQDEILTHLARIADLKVISRTSVMQYKTGAPRNLREIGQQLGVAHVVEGSVQRAANKIRVNAQLIDARTDAHLWAQTYDRDLADVFAIQSEIAKAIADQLQAKLSPNEKKAIEQPPTTDLAAFDLYSRAKSLLLMAGFSATSEPDERKAIELLDEAVKRDPSFFDAYCQLAYAHEIAYAVRGYDHIPARLALAAVAVQAATQLRPDAAETHLARAQYFYYGLRDYAGALSELEIARRALPNDPRLFELTGYILRRRGQQEEGLRNLERAVELDPRNFYTLQQIALSYQFLGRYAEAIAALDRASAIMPDNVETRANRGLWYMCWKGDTRPLQQTIDAILAQGSGAIVSAADIWFFCALAERDAAAAQRALVALGDNQCWNEGAIILSHSFGEGLLARMTKDETRARTAFEAARARHEKLVLAQPDYGPPLCVLGLIDAALGRKDPALDEGRRAIALTPVEKDLNNGSRVLQYFAITAAWAGEKELALKQLEAGLRAPQASVMLSYGALKLLPFWDPLRGDPRFERIVASLAPVEPPK
ncbi:MAG TPA: adenylate/guanylate cyclase domain-containing protein [Candidatus Udaeobacter sp.]|nr:adenylate/guanylate cyclase domain-containing protein [Candidatus Udaeobacter sp.]